jgi:hypothetical protein
VLPNSNLTSHHPKPHGNNISPPRGPQSPPTTQNHPTVRHHHARRTPTGSQAHSRRKRRPQRSRKFTSLLHSTPGRNTAPSHMTTTLKPRHKSYNSLTSPPTRPSQISALSRPRSSASPLELSAWNPCLASSFTLSELLSCRYWFSR